MSGIRKTSVIGEIAVVGAGARLPGAPDVDAFWELLRSGKNTVSDAPEGRWSVGRFLRPGEPQPGFAYTFAGGYLSDPFGFDPALFGISHREARQMDPQQRTLLEVTWRAFEDANIPISSLAGQNVGVYVGASNVDYQNSASHDPAVMESHYMTGNSLSVLSNRLSHAFDLRGPSFTVDSACSSSFVALNEAMAALTEGRIDLAVVGGVNLLLSPAPFIGFSQAHMLSPTGRFRRMRTVMYALRALLFWCCADCAMRALKAIRFGVYCLAPVQIRMGTRPEFRFLRWAVKGDCCLLSMPILICIQTNWRSLRRMARAQRLEIQSKPGRLVRLWGCPGLNLCRWDRQNRTSAILNACPVWWGC
ncbi:MAG TPA: hypothetical protein DDW73_06930 [Rhizobium sp.]|jgi:hypothetical protein|nr:hypothetical protein [Rhizobium sp.]